ncbi:alanine/glycine:cation symporter family protein [Psychrobacter sanguinis]|mgnify:CR=1 FL=1|uniref:alanine/glycine:cation symporter family protein n=1 Tax=Psychrobacter sanguinis TaxID=861445 RepID=UPI00020C7620|nr:alanine/glycine:cation symporter family protein [Psychrobacter sanguinis]EGK14743.1 AGCS family alanine or glycine:sodium (Na+) or proton (H+) symporter [Psychrobacter sp. 1501(2011)]MCC3308388.1 alanine:cation symporter family protein [Psychrobacter sanguinis]MCC3346332.1 alanine:cation symporter family protein [Psychrobacter sanguinis]MCD9150922.1 alanine:cation symporter family protein [Psychrobacter sanguinis]MDY3306167.1 alanine/glycine:cation symporter family protein [Psychrobacter sa
MEGIVSALNDIIWSPALIYLCLGAGLFYSIMTRFVQIRLFKEMIRLLFKGKPDNDGISSFQALAVALAGRVGMGNIAGVAAAIGFGGPGAVFWMWIVAFLGASTAYVESTLGQIYKERDVITGEYRGGPAYYFERALGQKWYGILFAISSIIACGIFLPGVQANGVVNAVAQVTGEGTMMNFMGMDVGSSRLIALAIILLVLGFIIFGGIKRIANFAEYAVPFMAVGYIALAILIMFTNFSKVPEVFGMIIGDAFSAQAGFGAAIGWGVKRGIYSNEAGQGTGPHAAAAASVDHPSQQGLVQAFSVYVDTLLVCSATAFMILSTGMYNIQGTLEDGQFIVQNVAADIEINSPSFTQMAMESVYGTFGDSFIAIAVFFFAFTTILAYYYIAEVNISYLTRSMGKGASKTGLFLVKVVIMIMVAYGALNSSGYIWGLGDVGVGLMAWLNIVGIIIIFFVAKPTLTMLKDYEAQLKAGGGTSDKRFVFDPKKFGIKNATYWEERYKQTVESNRKNDLK